MVMARYFAPKPKQILLESYVILAPTPSWCDLLSICQRDWYGKRIKYLARENEKINIWEILKDWRVKIEGGTGRWPVEQDCTYLWVKIGVRVFFLPKQLACKFNKGMREGGRKVVVDAKSPFCNQGSMFVHSRIIIKV